MSKELSRKSLESILQIMAEKDLQQTIALMKVALGKEFRYSSECFEDDDDSERVNLQKITNGSTVASVKSCSNCGHNTENIELDIKRCPYFDECNNNYKSKWIEDYKKEDPDDKQN